MAVYFTTRGRSYHTERDCRALNDSRVANRVMSTDNPDELRRQECRWCSGDAIAPTGHDVSHRNHCRKCGRFNANGDCEFCRRFDRIHDRPRDEPVPNRCRRCGYGLENGVCPTCRERKEVMTNSQPGVVVGD